MNQRTPQNRPHPEYLPWRSKRMVSRETRRMQGGALASSTAVAFATPESAVVAFVGATLVVALDALFLVLLRHGAGQN